MKILKIELQNINSLKSETPIVIDFGSEHFKGVGLYAITGSTGAGKTTILDAICIALYQNVPRFNKSHVNAGLEDVVSYGADSSMARVTFASKENIFEAQWSIRLKTKSGKILTKPKEDVRLKNLSTGKIIAEKKKELKIEVERITQLNYKQFLRSVLLAQGEFAAFLSANAKDKGELLEQITGEEIYKKIGQEIRNKISLEAKNLDAIKSKINNEDLLSEEKRKELKIEHSLLSEKNKILSKELSKINKITSWYKKYNELISTKNMLNSELVEFEKEINLKQEIINKLELHEKAEPFKEHINNIKRLKTEIKEKQNRFDELNIELEKILGQINSTKKITEESKEKSKQTEDNLNNWMPKLETVSKLDTDITNYKLNKEKFSAKINELTDLVSGINKNIKKNEDIKDKKNILLNEITKYLQINKNTPEFEKKLTDWSTKLTHRKNNIERIVNDLKIITEKEQLFKKTKFDLLEKNKVKEKENNSLKQKEDELRELIKKLKSYNLKSLLTKKEVFKKQKDKWELTKNLSNEFIENKKKKSELSKKKFDFERLKFDFENNLKKINLKIKDAENSLKDIETILSLEHKIKSFSHERKKLKKGEACKLCGSTEHPLIEKYEEIETSETEKQLEERKYLLEKLKTEAKNTEIEIGKLNTQLENNSAQEKTITKNISEITRKYSELKFECKITETETIKKNISTINEDLNSVSKKIILSQELQNKKEQKEDAIKLQIDIVNNLRTKIASLQEKSTNLNEEIKQKQNSLQELKQETKLIEDSLSADFSLFELRLPLPEETSQFINKLETAISTYNKKTKDLVNIKATISQLENDTKHNMQQLGNILTDKNNLQNEIEELKMKLSKATSERKAILPIGITTDTKRHELQKEKEETKQKYDRILKHLQKLQTTKTTLEKEKENNVNDEIVLSDKLKLKLTEFEKELKLSDFNSITEIEKALLNHDKKTEFLNIRNNLNEKKIKLETLEEKLKNDRGKLETDKNFDISFNENLKKQEDEEANKEELLKRLGEIKEQLKKDNEIKERNKGIFTKIQEQEKVLKKWTDLMNLLGGSKDAFNTYVQRLTLKNLIQFANIHLYKLNKRYSLKMDDFYNKNEELNFKLIDHFQTDEARYVDTSSGGEKFLISLALALGLSDLASNNVNIGSLFIDEGFGTLDSNTLEIVISTLETLQSQGKMIGIISHVENLKERIPTQIQVLKKSNGVSVVKII